MADFNIGTSLAYMVLIYQTAYQFKNAEHALFIGLKNLVIFINALVKRSYLKVGAALAVGSGIQNLAQLETILLPTDLQGLTCLKIL